MKYFITRYRPSLKIILLAVISSYFQPAFGFGWVERSRDQFGKDPSYFLYPIVIDIPGLGSSAGLGSTILNMDESDLDFSGFVLRGDFDVTGGTFLNYHILKNTLLFDVGFYDFEAAVISYDRGINSNKDSYIIPRLNGRFLETQLSWTMFDRHLESFLKFGIGKQQVTEVLDSEEQEFKSVDDAKRDQQQISLGFRFDNTSDRLHPKIGYRLEMAIKMPKNSDYLISDYVVADYNATVYFPFRKHDTLAFNFFRSDAHITSEVTASASELKAARGLGCATSFPANSPELKDCEATETSRINQIIAHNKYGTASSLGGTQRLRSFANNRFYAGHSMFYGVEYRLNLNDDRKPFDFYIARGIRTGLQLAFFAEQGSVAERTSDLFDTLKTSYGVGFRVILTGVVLRADYSNGTEGDEFLLFIDYPWSLLSIDS